MASAVPTMSPIVNRQLLPMASSAVATDLLSSLVSHSESWWTPSMPAHQLQLHEAGVRRLYERLRAAQTANAVLPATESQFRAILVPCLRVVAEQFGEIVDHVVFRTDELLEQSDVVLDIVLRSDNVPNGLFSRMAREAFKWPEDLPFLLQFQLLPFSEGLEVETLAHEAGDERTLGISLLGG